MWENLSELIEKAKPYRVKLCYNIDHLQVWFIYLTGVKEFAIYENEIIWKNPILHP